MRVVNTPKELKAGMYLKVSTSIVFEWVASLKKTHPAKHQVAYAANRRYTGI
jgi:hypothetical protein